MESLTTNGRVTLVGAGPGDPELLTLKAHRRLLETEVIVYDRLVSDAILALVPTGVMRIFAGKSCKHHAMSQDEINELLVTLARCGKRVVRLKGGDPFMFGRGGEEAAYLRRHGVHFEIVPGITSANGCSTYAGIPLTHRELATGVRYVTGHRMHGEETLNLDWPALADVDTTLVIYMGLNNLPLISQNLITHGLDMNTPAAAIQQATLDSQRRIIGTLATLPALVEDAKLESPALLIIGRVVSLAGSMDRFGEMEIKASINKISFR